MMPQPFCCLPWCGASFGAPSHSRVFVVDGKRVRLTYPSMIEMHDVVRRSQGGDPEDIENNVPLCHDCHSAHHSKGGRRLEFRMSHGRWHVLDLGERITGDGLTPVSEDGCWRALRVADECETP